MPASNHWLGVPEREPKPRNKGLTHVIDKGLNLRDIEGLFDTAGDYVDVVKLGWGTSYVTRNLEKKIALYRSFETPVVCGGTLFEAVVARGKIDCVSTVDRPHAQEAAFGVGDPPAIWRDGCRRITIADRSVLMRGRDPRQVSEVSIPFASYGHTDRDRCADDEDDEQRRANRRRAHALILVESASVVGRPFRGRQCGPERPALQRS